MWVQPMSIREQGRISPMLEYCYFNRISNDVFGESYASFSTPLHPKKKIKIQENGKMEPS